MMNWTLVVFFFVFISFFDIQAKPKASFELDLGWGVSSLSYKSLYSYYDYSVEGLGGSFQLQALYKNPWLWTRGSFKNLGIFSSNIKEDEEVSSSKFQSWINLQSDIFLGFFLWQNPFVGDFSPFLKATYGVYTLNDESENLSKPTYYFVSAGIIYKKKITSHVKIGSQFSMSFLGDLTSHSRSLNGDMKAYLGEGFMQYEKESIRIQFVVSYTGFYYQLENSDYFDVKKLNFNLNIGFLFDELILF